MKKKVSFLCLILLVSFWANALTISAKDYSYVTVPNDPLNARIYTLNNGLKVYLSVNKEQPRIQTYIAVRVGGKNDPSETTGLAHYFEHLMFKGTQKYGTMDYEKEKPYLDQIEEQFEIYRKTKDETQRKAIYHVIDSLSYAASKYAIPNEYDKLMAAIGAKGSNAYTSFDVTCFTEDIPSNELENWAKIQSDRFQNAVIRGFHTELEAVYEEKNMSLTNDTRKTYEALLKSLFTHHPYGTQTVLGTQENLKNPSITNIKNYYKTWYVPNNIAICMSGDLDPEKTIQLIDEYFGKMEPNSNLPKLHFEAEAPIEKPIVKEVLGPDADRITLGWRFPGQKSPEFDYLNIISEIMSNGKAGLVDLNLNQAQKVLGAGAGTYPLSDYSVFMMIGVPKAGQSLDEVRSLLIEQINKLKAGDFDNDLLKAIINNIKLNRMKALENNESRADMFVDSFVNGTDWKDEVERIDRLSKITKKEVMDFAVRYFGDNYAVVYKRQGKDPNELKIAKPKITPIETNRNISSVFLKSIQNSVVRPIEPVFLDFKKDLTQLKAQSNIPVLYKKNTTNGLFELTYVFDMGNNNDKLYDIASDYMDYLGTSKKTAEQIKSEFYQLACDYNFIVNNDRMYIFLEGLNENMPKAMALMEEVLSDTKVDIPKYKNLVSDVMKARSNAKLNQQRNFRQLCQYGYYGPKNPSTNVLTNKQLQELNPQVLIDKIHHLNSFKHQILYYGPSNEKEFITLVNSLHKTPAQLKNVPAGIKFTMLKTPTNKVLFAHYDAKQIYMQMTSNRGEKFDATTEPTRQLFNEYFGGGMNSIVFQELREARGLAYSAYAIYNRPSKLEDTYYMNSFIASQNDKMMDAIDTYKKILNDMPSSETAFNIAKEGMITRMRTERILKSDILWSYLDAKRLGLDYDMRKVVFEKIPALTLKDINEYQQKNIKGRTYTYCILGDEKNLDMEKLKAIGPIQMLSQEEIFGY